MFAGKKSDGKVLLEVLEAWKWYTGASRRRNHLDTCISVMRTKGWMKRCFIAWRQCAHLLFRKRSVKRRQYEVEHATYKAKYDIDDELETLRKMIVDLTEDLRTETIAKNTLKYQYE
jgi:hypothetical protein